MIPFLVQAVDESLMLNTTILKFFMPVFVFIFVFALMYALFKKTEILGDSPFPILVVSFVIAIIFVVTPTAFKFTNVITPWLIVFIISLLFIFLILSWLDVYKLGGEGLAGAVGNPWVAWLVIGVILIIFIYAGIQTFGTLLNPFGSQTGGAGTGVIGSGIKNTLFHPAILGMALLFIIAAVTAWVIGIKSK
ncbi:hypothetical protein B6U80_02135 [Candidatus Pacearchaeota archaeon ex4484_26]|nr:MAG: hypothetical protein B6U80_02135 [Candidatus Pacearchaeota archaeon ex4484_26]RLF37134.1 MAG: hypothetical protein DRM99_01210 [Thermoplasmata archaeon]